jgi:hypothetical protein
MVHLQDHGAEVIGRQSNRSDEAPLQKKARTQRAKNRKRPLQSQKALAKENLRIRKERK